MKNSQKLSQEIPQSYRGLSQKMRLNNPFTRKFSSKQTKTQISNSQNIKSNLDNSRKIATGLNPKSSRLQEIRNFF